MDTLNADNLLAQRIVVMGVAGCGKSTVALALAERIGGEFVEGDDLHDDANIKKMSSGEALTDEDRWPWLERLVLVLANSQTPVIASCSSLKRIYRDRIRQQCDETLCFVHLTASYEAIEQRMQQRTGHFMPAALLSSQFAVLEPLQPDEAGVDVSAIGEQQEVIDATMAAIMKK